MSVHNEAGSLNAIAGIDLAIERCAKYCNHPLLSPGFVPSRLLFLGSYDDDDKVRVVTRADATNHSGAAGVRYAALSYCWGLPRDAQSQCKTEQRTLAARLAHVPSAELSPVVGDAVAVTRRLGIRYLWVDSLCIIQDDGGDWEAESALMGPIYSNAYVTIVCLNSGSCQVGFLAGREWPYFSTGTEVKTTTASANTTTGAERGAEGSRPQGDVKEDVGVNTWHFMAALSKARWSTRGWTFQEKSLSTRLLYFDSTNVHLRCSNYTFRDGRAGPVLGRQLSILEPADDDAITDASGLAGSLTESWRNILVPRFSACKFSAATDKLPAIAGLARYIGDVTGYGYVAGLWVPCLHMDLAWGYAPVHSSFESLFDALDPTEDGYIAPSWSWARFESMERLGFADVSTTGLEIAARFEVSVELAGSNPYGQVSNGNLTVTSKILPLLRDHGKAAGGTHSGFALDWIVKEGSKLPVGLQMVLVGSYTATVRVWPDGDVYEKRAYGIIVHPAHLREKYYRVGMFNCPVSEESWLDFENAGSRVITIS
jgi:Heterokaryon incompatibility protein (HET)